MVSGLDPRYTTCGILGSNPGQGMLCSWAGGLTFLLPLTTHSAGTFDVEG